MRLAKLCIDMHQVTEIKKFKHPRIFNIFLCIIITEFCFILFLPALCTHDHINNKKIKKKLFSLIYFEWRNLSQNFFVFSFKTNYLDEILRLMIEKIPERNQGSLLCIKNRGHWVLMGLPTYGEGGGRWLINKFWRLTNFPPNTNAFDTAHQTLLSH